MNTASFLGASIQPFAKNTFAISSPNLFGSQSLAGSLPLSIRKPFDPLAASLIQEIIETAKREGVVLLPDSKVGLFIGGPHIEGGYYYGLFSYAIKHLFPKHSDELVYLPFPIDPHDPQAAARLTQVKSQLRHDPQLVGAVITRPWKEHFLDVDENHSQAQAVNYVVKNDANELLGFAVDGDAWIDGLNYDLGYPYVFSGKRLVILGVGGAAKELASALLGRGISQIAFADPDATKRQDMHDLLKALTAGDYSYRIMEADTPHHASKELHAAIREADLVINATGIGRGTTAGQSPIANDVVFKPNSIASDLISNENTTFLQQAHAQGIPYVFTGRSMFIFGMVRFIKGWWQQLHPEKLPVDFDKRAYDTIAAYPNEKLTSHRSTQKFFISDPTHPPVTLFEPTDKQIQTILAHTAASYEQVQASGNINLQDLQTFAIALNPNFPIMPETELADAHWKTFVEFVWRLHWHIFLPARLYATFPFLGRHRTPVTWQIDDASWRWDPYLHSGIWIADMSATDDQQSASRILGHSMGPIALVDHTSSAENAREEFHNVITRTPKSSWEQRQHRLVVDLVSQGRLNADIFARYFGRNKTEAEERREAQAFRFAEGLHPNIENDFEEPLILVNAILKPSSPIAERYWPNAVKPVGATPILELESKLGSALDSMNAFMARGDSEMAYLVFLQFWETAAHMNAERHALLEHGESADSPAVLYRFYAQLAISSLIRQLGQSYTGQIAGLFDSVLLAVHDEEVITIAALNAFRLMQDLYAMHFWTDSERRALLFPNETLEDRRIWIEEGRGGLPSPILKPRGEAHDVQPLSETIVAAWHAVSGFLIVCDLLPDTAQALILFGSGLPIMGRAAAELAQRLNVEVVVPSGGKGRLTPSEWSSEGAILTELIRIVAPHLHVLAETTATTTFENALKAWKIIEKEISSQLIIIGMQLPIQSLRAKQMLRWVIDHSGIQDSSAVPLSFQPAFETDLDKPQGPYSKDSWSRWQRFEAASEVAGLLGYQDPANQKVAATQLPLSILEHALLLGLDLLEDPFLAESQKELLRPRLETIRRHINSPPPWSPTLKQSA